MVRVGRSNLLEAVRTCDYGLLLDGGELGEILMPRRYVAEGMKPGDKVEAFIMLDSEDRLTATTLKPLALAGECAYLRVVSATPVGAFLDWGMPKDLLVPFREQKVKMRVGSSYLVHVYHDRASGRLAASSKIDKFLDKTKATYSTGDQVNVIVNRKTDLGYTAIINHKHSGIFFHNEVFQPMRQGQQLEAFIKQVRPDGKIDLCLHKPGYEKVTKLTGVILNHLKSNGGFMPVTDRNSPEEIHALFGVSKKTYKMAIGALYKKRLIAFENDGTKLV